MYAPALRTRVSRFSGILVQKERPAAIMALLDDVDHYLSIRSYVALLGTTNLFTAVLAERVGLAL
jgi:hypothetical protein